MTPKSLLANVGKAIATALETARKAGTFGIDEFVTDWDFEGRRGPDDLPDENLHVTVIVPQGWESITKVDRDPTWEHVGAFDVDVRRKLGLQEQDAAGEIDRDEIDRYVALVEAVHTFFTTLEDDDEDQSRLTIASHGKTAEWVDERTGVGEKSRIVFNYSELFLKEARQFFGMCREVFVIE